MEILQARKLEWVALPPPGNLPNSGIESRSPALQIPLLTELSGKPKNTGVGSLPLLQGIFLIQELNWGLLHCRWILYQLSYQGRRSDCSHDINCHNSEDWPQRNGNKLTLDLKINCM